MDFFCLLCGGEFLSVDILKEPGGDLEGAATPASRCSTLVSEVPPPFWIMYEDRRAFLLEGTLSGIVKRKVQLPLNPSRDYEVMYEDEDYYVASKSLSLTSWEAWPSKIFTVHLNGLHVQHSCYSMECLSCSV